MHAPRWRANGWRGATRELRNKPSVVARRRRRGGACRVARATRGSPRAAPERAAAGRSGGRGDAPSWRANGCKGATPELRNAPCVVARRHESEPTGAAALLPLTPFCVQPFLHLPGPPNFGMSAQFAQAPQSAWIAGAEVARGAFATQMVLQQCSIIISLRRRGWIRGRYIWR